MTNTPYFHVKQVADGVYAAIARDESGAWGNAGFVDLGDSTLVFDAMLTPEAALSLRRTAEQVTNHPVSLLVNSHYHFDHVLGNQAFRDIQIISTTRTRELIAERLHVVTDTLALKAELQRDNQELASLIQTESVPQIRTGLRGEIAERERFIEALPSMQLTLPHLTFSDRMTIHGSSRDVELITLGGGHTSSDAMLWLPKEEVLFAGDLVLVQTHPMVVDGDPDEWLTLLEQIQQIKPKSIVPGHGPVGTFDDIGKMTHYIHQVRETAYRAIESGLTLSQVLVAPLPAAYENWRFAHVFRWNLEYWYTKRVNEMKSVEEPNP